MALDETVVAEPEVVEDVAAEEVPAEPVVVEDEEDFDTSTIESGQMPRVMAELEPKEEAKEEEVKEEAEEESKEDEPKEEEPKDDEAEKVEEAPVFDDLDAPALVEKVNEVADKYELPEDLQAAIAALAQKAQSAEAPEIVTKLADYGDADAITAALERDNLLYGVTVTEDGSIRPNTDKYVEQLVTNDAEKADWLYFDLSKAPSAKYKGLNKFEEGICDALGTPEDTVGTVMERYNRAMMYAKDGLPAEEVPAYVPAHLYDAYKALPPETRADMTTWIPDEDGYDAYARERAIKLNELAQIQKGIDADKREIVETQQKDQQQKVEFQSAVLTTQSKFFESMRSTFTENLAKEVTFSADPALQNLLVNQNVALLSQAFLNDSDGAFARKALEDSGIKFDHAKAQGLIKDIQDASVALTIAQKQKDANGKPLNTVEFNKATSAFKAAGSKWQDFAQDIVNQQKKLTATGKAEEVKAEVAKVKVPVKARPAVKTTPTVAEKGKDKVPRFGTPEYTNYWANKQLEELAQRAGSYR